MNLCPLCQRPLIRPGSCNCGWEGGMVPAVPRSARAPTVITTQVPSQKKAPSTDIAIQSHELGTSPCLVCHSAKHWVFKRAYEQNHMGMFKTMEVDFTCENCGTEYRIKRRIGSAHWGGTKVNE